MKTILLVEGNPNQRLLYRLELEDAGYRVLLASSGADAVGTARNELPDLVVMDPFLPDLEAPMVAKLLRVKHPGLPIIVQSGDVLQRVEADGYASEFVLKSSDLSLLVDAVCSVVGKREEMVASA